MQNIQEESGVIIFTMAIIMKCVVSLIIVLAFKNKNTYVDKFFQHAIFSIVQPLKHIDISMKLFSFYKIFLALEMCYIFHFCKAHAYVSCSDVCMFIRWWTWKTYSQGEE